MAMLKIREYQIKALCTVRLSQRHISIRFKYRESNAGGSEYGTCTYYDRKKEAILLVCHFWGTADPRIERFLGKGREEEALCYCEC